MAPSGVCRTRRARRPHRRWLDRCDAMREQAAVEEDGITRFDFDAHDLLAAGDRARAAQRTRGCGRQVLERGRRSHG